MVVTKYFAKFRAVTGVFAAAGLSIAAHPAMANSSAAAADISAPLRTAQSASQSVSGGEDEQFRKLFSSWQNFEETGLAVSKAKPAVAGGIASVSIPSRNPLNRDVMTSSFGEREHPILGRRRMHKGVDLAAPIGTPVYAPADGVVSRASWFSSYGLYISIEHGAEMETRYGHLSRLNVADGQHVHKGDVIGFVGTTGRSTGPHLHYEVRVDGEAVNPLPYMQSPAGLAAAEEAENKGG
ncbi:M23 family metallopeptidase [Novosphingobium mangrovi (ex Huang et al. 2023)]|uniref:M23 family metallopeptidase n=1 Tax=Novosphingobium mangrovi (ex Huang et al. 2023) TaxID=2976432 RepID=A0ABT2I9T1_9SPHN|nr:M23 family metallopeptidase [Novosphingobium mangrovi (ex Huang et al. 2023)]MCT2401579.1 M23 family metallopeptidase [Novosphingobium mangrovi (ex Huang et al. 2023)]